MSKADGKLGAAEIIRMPIVVITLVVLLVVVLIWLFAFFLPQGKKLNTLNAQEQTLQNEQNALTAKVNALKELSKYNPQVIALQNTLTTAVPASPGTYPYIATISNTATASGVTIISFTPPSTAATQTTPGAAPTSPTTKTGGVQTLPFTIGVSGSYDQILTFIQAIYALPRLTVINSVQITGGGVGTNRASPLQASFTMSIFTTGQSASTTSS